MKVTQLILVTCAAINLALSPHVSAKDSEEALQKQASVPLGQAEKAALSKVWHGATRSVEIMKQRGRLIWAFVVAEKNSESGKQVHVDAKSGDVLSVKAVRIDAATRPGFTTRKCCRENKECCSGRAACCPGGK